MRRTLVLGVALLAAMAVGRVITDHVPLAQVASAPFVRTGGVGDDVHLRYADVEADRVRSARFLVVAGQGVRAGGRFLVVDATLTARAQPETLTYVALHDAHGRTFFPTTRAGCTDATTDAPTGLAWHVMYCFDIPRSALAGSTLEISKGAPGTGGEQARDDLARIALGIDDARAARLWSTTTTYAGYSGGLDRPSLKPLPAPTGSDS